MELSYSVLLTVAHQVMEYDNMSCNFSNRLPWDLQHTLPRFGNKRPDPCLDLTLLSWRNVLSRVEVHGASCPTMKSDTMIVDTLLLTVKKLMLKILIGWREEIELSYKVFVFRGDSKMDDNPALLSSDVISRSYWWSLAWLQETQRI